MILKKCKSIWMYLPLLACTSQMTMAMDVKTIEALGLARDHIATMTVSHNPTTANERYPISAQYVVAVALDEMQKLNTDPTYVPNAQERKALYICDHVLNKIHNSPATSLTAYVGQASNPNLRSLTENKYVSYNIAEDTLGGNGGQYVIKGSDLSKSIQAMESRVLMNDITLWVNEYFKRPYRDEPNYKAVSASGLKVYRPNHALHHALRTAFIAVDMLDAFASTPANSFSTKAAKTNATLIQTCLAQDPLLRAKVFMTAAYQRTGRESEVSGKEGDWAAKLYSEYLQRDSEFFTQKATELLKKNIIFSDEVDVRICAKALLNGKPDADFTPDQENKTRIIRSFIWAGHMFELKRLANSHAFNPNSNYNSLGIKLAAASNVFPGYMDNHGSDDWKHYTLSEAVKGTAEEKFINRIWDRMEGYLEVTGDRPVKSSHDGKAKYQDHFFTLAHAPSLLLNELLKAQTKMA